MMSGRETLSSIERAILGVRAEENRLAVMLQSATEEALQLRAQKAENFKALAAIELDSLARDQVAGDLDAVERRAMELLQRRRQRLAEVAERRSKALDEATAAETEHAKWAAALEAARSQIDELTAALETRVKDEPDWAMQQARVAQAEATAKAAADKASQAEADRKSKGKPYENEPLFMYLWRSYYGTVRYRAWPIRRYLDGKVAKLVGYDSACADYRMLTEIPLRLRQHADRLEEAAHGELAKRTAIERRALEGAGVVALETNLDAAVKNLEQTETRLSRAKSKLSELDAEANDEAADPDYRQAVETLTERLSREDLGGLYQKALRTPGPDDDRIVQSLQQQEQAITRADTQIVEIRRAVIQLAQRRVELEQSRSRFQQAGYDDPLGGFVNGAIIGTVLGGILNGSRSPRNLDDVLSDGFRRQAPRGFGGGMRVPGGRSWGGGGFRTGGEF
jgi:hypothetical protein